MAGGGKKSKRDGDRKKDKKRGRDERGETYELDDYEDEDSIPSNLDEKAISNEWSVPTAAAVDVETKVWLTEKILSRLATHSFVFFYALSIYANNDTII